MLSLMLKNLKIIFFPNDIANMQIKKFYFIKELLPFFLSFSTSLFNVVKIIIFLTISNE